MSATCKCGQPSDGWPDDMCQDCWEADCDRSWWDNLTGPGPMLAMARLDEGDDR